MVKKRDIEKLVFERKISNLKNHWRDSFFYNSTKYSGEIRHNEILMWRSSLFLRASYPIFYLTFDQNNELTAIKTEKNPYHLLLNKIIGGILIIYILGIFFSTNFQNAITIIFTFSIIGILLYFVLRRAIKYETKLLIKELKEAIDQIEQARNSEKTNSTPPIISKYP